MNVTEKWFPKVYESNLHYEDTKYVLGSVIDRVEIWTTKIQDKLRTKLEKLKWNVSNRLSDFQIQWLFNERPVHGKDFLVSVSGDRQVLTIPETGSTHVGTISCVAENAAGKAVCSARLDIGEFQITDNFNVSVI